MMLSDSPDPCQILVLQALCKDTNIIVSGIPIIPVM